MFGINPAVLLAAGALVAGAGIGAVIPEQAHMSAGSGDYCYTREGLWKSAEVRAHQVADTLWKELNAVPKCSHGGGTPFHTRTPIGVMIIDGNPDTVYSVTFRGGQGELVQALTDDLSLDKI